MLTQSCQGLPSNSGQVCPWESSPGHPPKETDPGESKEFSPISSAFWNRLSGTLSVNDSLLGTVAFALKPQSLMESSAVMEMFFFF